ncbi:MAG TPA: hypothetical protein VFV10_03140 [Gammaproteobacteria bacterium]|nr:hypothetical protein [Gammaproteobacteria bacterium]
MLNALHELLAEIYDLEVSYDIDEFLVTDASVAAALDVNGRRVEEKLLIAEGAGHAEVSLYLERGLVDRLEAHDPSDRLDARNLADFWTAFEGVSHFAYYAWNAEIGKAVRLLEMELQAEVDKFIGTRMLLERQGERPPPSLHAWLFDLPRYDEQLSSRELTRYRHANRYAAKYCMKLAPALDRRTERDSVERELRQFYRLTQPEKIKHIDSR